jgi:hypothetical protein
MVCIHCSGNALAELHRSGITLVKLHCSISPGSCTEYSLVKLHCSTRSAAREPLLLCASVAASGGPMSGELRRYWLSGRTVAGVGRIATADLSGPHSPAGIARWPRVARPLKGPFSGMWDVPTHVTGYEHTYNALGTAGRVAEAESC